MRNLPVASGPGWSVTDVICTAGPGDRPFEERHELACVAAVTGGTFQYRTRQGSAVLAPGALLLGQPGASFQCAHDHGTGDRCLSFHFTPDTLEEVAAALPKAVRPKFERPCLPPLPELVSTIAMAEAARDGRDDAALEEAALDLAAIALSGISDRSQARVRTKPRDEKRVSDILRLIECRSHEPLSLTGLARRAGLSRYHFLRVFRAVAGLPPHQYVLRSRLHRAAVRLRASNEGIAAIAFDVGFEDLSSFNHRFRRITGLSPGEYRAPFAAAGRQGGCVRRSAGGFIRRGGPFVEAGHILRGSLPSSLQRKGRVPL